MTDLTSGVICLISMSYFGVFFDHSTNCQLPLTAKMPGVEFNGSIACSASGGLKAFSDCGRLGKGEHCTNKTKTNTKSMSPSTSSSSYKSRNSSRRTSGKSAGRVGSAHMLSGSPPSIQTGIVTGVAVVAFATAAVAAAPRSEPIASQKPVAEEIAKPKIKGVTIIPSVRDTDSGFLAECMDSDHAFPIYEAKKRAKEFPENSVLVAWNGKKHSTYTVQRGDIVPTGTKKNIPRGTPMVLKLSY